MYEAGSKSVNNQTEPSTINTDQLYEAGTCLRQDREELCTQLAVLMRQLQISNTASKDLTQQVQVLGSENNRMKEELAFFQHLMSGKAELDNDLSIYRFSLKRTSTAEIYRYTITLVQSGQRPTDFSGYLKFIVNLKQNGKIKNIPLTNKSSEKGFPVNFRFFHKIDENFRIPADAHVESLQVQVYENDATKAILTQTIEPSS